MADLALNLGQRKNRLKLMMKVDVEELIQLANYESGRHESGSCGSVRAQLERLKDTYGFDYEIKLSYCGTEVDGISIVDEVD